MSARVGQQRALSSMLRFTAHTKLVAAVDRRSSPDHVRGMGAPRWLLMCAAPLVAALSGCGWGHCEEHGLYELSDWSLGTHVATLTWLWTGAVTELSLTGVPGNQTASTDCETVVRMDYALSTADGAIDQSVKQYPTVGSDGSFSWLGLSLEFEAEPTLVVGVAPELADLAKRHPRLRLVVPRDRQFSDGELRLLTTRDDVTLATLQFRSTP
jgi:hypothetical protein